MRNGDSSPGRLEALINNAGIGYGGPLELLHPDHLRKQFDVNVLGQVAVTQALLPALRAAHGRIVFMSSVGGRVATPHARDRRGGGDRVGGDNGGLQDSGLCRG